MPELFRIESNDKAIRDAMAQYPKQATRAMARTLNKAAKSTRTDISKRVRGEWNIKKKDVDRKITIGKATRVRLFATLKAAGRRLSLVKFGAKDKRPKGVTVKVKASDKRHYPHAFIAKTNRIGRESGSLGKAVYVRTTKSRLPLRALLGPSIAFMIGLTNVIQPVLKTAGQKIVKTFSHEFARERAKGKR